MTLLRSAEPAATPARRAPRRSVVPGPARSAPVRRRPDAVVGLIVLAWAYVLLPRLVQSLLAPKFRLGVGETAPTAPAAHLLEVGLRVALVALCVGVVLRRSGSLPTDRRIGLLVLLAPWVYVVCRDLYLRQDPTLPGLLYPLLVVALWVCRPPLHRLAVIGVLTSVTALVSIALALVDPTKGILTNAPGSFVAAEKELLPLGLLVGPFQGSNNLGRILLLGLPFLGLVPHRTARLLLALPVVAALVASSSRSSIAAAATALLLAALLLRLPTGRRALVAASATGAVLLTMALLPLTVSDPTAFSNRGLVWSESLHRWAQDPVFGLGSNWYTEAAVFGESIASTAYHGHNQLVHALTTGGLVGLVLVLALLGYLLAVSARWADRGSVVPAAFTVALFVSSVQEVNVGFVDREALLSSAAVGLIGVVTAARRAAPVGAVPPVRAPRRTG